MLTSPVLEKLQPSPQGRRGRRVRGQLWASLPPCCPLGRKLVAEAQGIVRVLSKTEGTMSPEGVGLSCLALWRRLWDEDMGRGLLDRAVRGLSKPHGRGWKGEMGKGIQSQTLSPCHLRDHLGAGHSAQGQLPRQRSQEGGGGLTAASGPPCELLGLPSCIRLDPARPLPAASLLTASSLHR